MSETGPEGVRAPLQVTPSTMQRVSVVWRVGQTLAAVVKEAGPAGVQLRIGSHAVTARSDVPLQQGQRLQLQVATTTPQITLRILQPPSTEVVLADASRSLLPRQAPQAQLVQSLITALANHAPSLPPDVRWAAQALVNVTPTPGSISQPEQLRAALANSGLLFESKLRSVHAGSLSTPNLTADAKGLLANLLQTLFSALASRPRSWQGGDQAPPNARHFVPLAATGPRLAPTTDSQALLMDLARQADGALARTQLTQVNLLAADGQLPWLFELPIRDGNRADQLQLVLDQETAPSEEGQDKIWTVRVSLDFPETGPLHCTVALQGQTVSTSWWAERRETALAVNEHLTALAERINGLGLSVTGMRCVHGRPPAPESEPDAMLKNGGRLFDEHV